MTITLTIILFKQLLEVPDNIAGYAILSILQDKHEIIFYFSSDMQ